MLTDWALIRRLAFEIEDRFRGAKVRDVGLLSDGRTAIALWARGATHLLCFDLFGSPPLVTVEDGELPIAVEPGFIRATGAALRGTTLLGVRARKGDRLMRLTFGTRSRFGVGETIDLFAELVPRFGNLILVKGDAVVAAAKEFSLADNGTRAIQAGMAYQAPPLQERPRLIAEDAVDPAYFESDEMLRGELYAYADDTKTLALSLVPLGRYPDAKVSRVPSLLDAFLTVRNTRSSGSPARTVDRRRVLTKRIDERERKSLAELEQVQEKRRRAAAREDLRRDGERIYATLHELDESSRDEEKSRATKLFSEYRKLGASIAHLDRREELLRVRLRAIAQLQWEIDNAEEADLDDVAQALAEFDPNPQRESNRAVRRKRPPMEVRTEAGSRILVGRSPSENADLTFRVARPGDWWFHAQNIPGAHVILQRDDRREPDDRDIVRAAAIAAFFSKAKASAKVPVDYTRRKHVRKQKDAPPGLVWYTDFRTAVVTPEAP